MKGKTAPKYCNPCRQKLEERFFCEDCGEEFVVTVSEKDYLKEKGFPLPKRCPDCRGKRKEKQKTAKSMAPRKTAGKRDYGSLVFDMFDMFDSFAPEPATVKPAAPAAQQAAAPKPAAKPVTPQPVVPQPAAPKPAPSPAAPVAQPVLQSEPVPQPALQPMPQPVRESAPVPQPAPKPVADTQTAVPLNTGEEPKREGYFVRAVRLFNNILKF